MKEESRQRHPVGAESLWRAVIGQAMTDATNYFAKGQNAELERHRAQTWLTDRSAHFDMVCALANLEPTRVRSFALKHIADAEKRLPELAAKASARTKKARAAHVTRAKRKQEQDHSNV